MTKIVLLTMLNTACCDECLLDKIDDVCSAIESGDCYAISDKDEITAIFMSRSGAALLRQVPMMPDATA